MQIDKIIELSKEYINKKLFIPSPFNYINRAELIWNSNRDKGLYLIMDGKEKVYYIGEAGYKKDGNISKRMINYGPNKLFEWLKDELNLKDDDKKTFKNTYYKNVIDKEWKVKVLYMPHIYDEKYAQQVEDFCFAVYKPVINCENKLFETLENIES